MNQLSWLIYWADAAPHLSTFVCITFFFLFVASFIGCIFASCCKSDQIKVAAYDKEIALWEAAGATWKDKPDSHSFGLDSSAREGAAAYSILRFTFLLCPFFFLGWGASFLVPEKDTFYLIAASEAGEQAVKTPEFTKVREILNKWMDQQLHPSDEKKDESSK